MESEAIVNLTLTLAGGSVVNGVVTLTTLAFLQTLIVDGVIHLVTGMNIPSSWVTHCIRVLSINITGVHCTCTIWQTRTYLCKKQYFYMVFVSLLSCIRHTNIDILKMAGNFKDIFGCWSERMHIITMYKNKSASYSATCISNSTSPWQRATWLYLYRHQLCTLATDIKLAIVLWCPASQLLCLSIAYNKIWV